MDSDWITLIFLGIAAALMPLVVGLEVAVLVDKEGIKKSTSLVGGVNLTRLLIAVVAVFVAAGVTAFFTRNSSTSGFSLGSVLSQLDAGFDSGENPILDGLRIVAGASIIVRGYQRLRVVPDTESPAGNTNSKMLQVGTAGAFGLGIAMSATNINQWILIVTGVEQILELHLETLGTIVVFLLFLLLANTLILLPLLIVLLRPEHARTDLQKLYGWIHGALRYVIAAVLFLIGLYLIWQGAMGFMNYLNT